MECVHLTRQPGNVPANDRHFCTIKNDYIERPLCSECADKKDTFDNPATVRHVTTQTKTNRALLDELRTAYSFHLHVEDPGLLYTIAAVKVSHKISGSDPVWMMIIGPSSDGKSEYLRSSTTDDEIAIEDVTPKTFISGWNDPEDPQPQIASRLKNSVWYIYDLSRILSKSAEDRAQILSDLRMIYDGRISKGFGNRKICTEDTTNSTLLCGSTPAVDSTILEDSILGTRFLTFRPIQPNAHAVMGKIDETEKTLFVMRPALKSAFSMFMVQLQPSPITLTEGENYTLQSLVEQTIKLRASVQIDRNGELRNIVYVEGAGRYYKEIKRLYLAYRMIGLSEEEAVTLTRKVCQDSVHPVRIRVLRWLVDKTLEWQGDNLNKECPKFTLSEIARGCTMGKGHTKGELSSLWGLGILAYQDNFDALTHRFTDEYWINPQNCNFGVLFGITAQTQLQEVKA